MVTKRIIAPAFFIMIFVCQGIFGQAITRVAVLDLMRLFDAYSRESIAAREFEEERNAVQLILEKMQMEINDLQKKKADALQNNNTEMANQLEKDINTKLKSLKDYYNGMKISLEEKKKKLMESSEFARTAYGMIQRIAEMEGYSIVLTSTSMDSMSNSIIWYSPMIDITDKVIEALK